VLVEPPLCCARSGVGKTLVSMLLIQEYFRNHSRPSINYANGDSTAKWAMFLAPTQQLVRQQAERVKSFTGLPTRSYVGMELDAWQSQQWRKEFTEIVSTLLIACGIGCINAG
jgi:ERCC4-related helicase